MQKRVAENTPPAKRIYLTIVRETGSNMLANRNLRLLVIGQFISAIGDQFYLIAMPWLALQTTGSAFVAGTVLAAASVPRAVFMLLGGVATDRFSAKTLLVVSNGIQALLMALLGVVILIPFTSLWFLYVMAFSTGLIDAFGLPAFTALLPRITDDDDLEGGNIYLQGANMASVVIGPALAGLLISLSSADSGSHSIMSGLGSAFLINALTFVVGISFFWAIRIDDDARVADREHDSLITSIRDVIEHVRGDTQLRTMFFVMMILGLLLTGTVRVGFALLADTQLSGGVQDFGNMNSALGVGLLAGMIGVKLLPRPPQAVSGLIVLGLFAFVPAGLILLGFAPPILITLAIILIMGIAFGYDFVYLLSWLQRRTPDRLLGRVMAVVMFSTIGLSPISQVLMGYLLDINIQATLIGAGTLVLALLIVTGVNREMWDLKH